MSDPVYINKDAEYLYTLGGTFIQDDDFEVGMRLQAIAANLQSIDDKYQARGVSDQFLAGKKAAYEELFERSNLPVEDRAMPLSAVKLGVGATFQVKRYPAGMTSSQLGQKVVAKEAKPKPADKRLAGLSGLKLNLSSFLKKE